MIIYQPSVRGQERRPMLDSLARATLYDVAWVLAVWAPVLVASPSAVPAPAVSKIPVPNLVLVVSVVQQCLLAYSTRTEWLLEPDPWRSKPSACHRVSWNLHGRSSSCSCLGRSPPRFSHGYLSGPTRRRLIYSIERPRQCTHLSFASSSRIRYLCLLKPLPLSRRFGVIA